MTEFTPIVTVPARNEEERLPAFFASLASQCWQMREQQPLKIIIVLNNCTDGSRDAVLSAMATYSILSIELIDVQFPAEKAHVGTARKLAMDTALASCADPAKTAILTTDADSTPMPDWVSNNVRHLADGIDLVCGTIWLNKEDYEKLNTGFTAHRQIDMEYNHMIDHLDALLNPIPHDPWPHHADYSGASIALRADVYQAVGGLPPLPHGEDYTLVEQVRQAGYLIRHPMDVVVETSARMVGRAIDGYAKTLQDCMHVAEKEKPFLVEHPTLTWQRLKAKQTALESNPSNFIPVEEATALLGHMIAEAESLPRAA